MGLSRLPDPPARTKAFMGEKLASRAAICVG
jgi:hypothetical protein